MRDRQLSQATAEVLSRTSDMAERALGGYLGSLLSKQIEQEATKLGGAKRELIPTIKGLPSDAMFTVITFGNQISMWEPALVQASSSYKTQGAAYIKGLSSGGGTPALRALEQAFRLYNIDTIFFVSDGRPTDSSTSRILERVRGLNVAKMVSINTIGLGNDQDETFMNALAYENGGTYIKK